MYAALAAEAALLVAAEWARGVELVVCVRPDHAGAKLRDYLKNLRAFVGPDAGAQTVRSVVRALDRFLGCAESHHAQHGSKDFLLCHTMARGHAGDEARRKPVTSLGQGTAWLDKFATFLHTGINK